MRVSSASTPVRACTQHVTQSAGRLSGPLQPLPLVKTAPELPRRDRRQRTTAVEGVDITVPVYHFAETHYLAADVVTETYRGVLFSLTGRINNSAFKGFAAGECLFLGATGSMRDLGDWEINFRFAASPNATGLTIGNITGISKKGWEYLWVRYADVEDGAAHTLVKRPVAVYVEQVYEYGNLSLLLIG